MKADDFVIENGNLLKYSGSDRAVAVPDGVTAVGERAFAGCASLEETVLPEGVRYIGEFAFANCARLKKVNLPASVKNVRNGAFDNTALYSDPANRRDGVLYLDGCLIR